HRSENIGDPRRSVPVAVGTGARANRFEIVPVFQGAPACTGNFIGDEVDTCHVLPAIAQVLPWPDEDSRLLQKTGFNDKRGRVADDRCTSPVKSYETVSRKIVIDKQPWLLGTHAINRR